MADLDSAEQTLLRAQIHTLRERLHLLERRLHDIEMAQRLDSMRAAVHGDEIVEIKTMIDSLTTRVDKLIADLNFDAGNK